MTRTQIVCLANSFKHGERCLAGINPATERWIRPVSLTYPNDGRVPGSTPVEDGQAYAILTYGKRSRSQMSDAEKQDFINYLRHASQANQSLNFFQSRKIPQMI